MKTARETLLADLKIGIDELSNGELIAWRIHVINNPYRGGETMEGFSDDVVKLIDSAMASRGIVASEYKPEVPPYMRGLVSQEQMESEIVRLDLEGWL